MNLIDLSYITSGTITLGQIVLSSPRKYAARCNSCQTTFILDHQATKLRLDQGYTLECPNDSCRRGLIAQVAKEQEYHQHLRQSEREADNAALEARMRARYGTASVTAVTP